MAKQGLGRGLGTLMGNPPSMTTTATNGSDSAVVPASTTTPAPAPVSMGVRTLMREQAPAAKLPLPEAKPAFPRWYLFAGDVLLVALALITLQFSPHPLSWQREAICTGLVVVAAILAMVAVWPASARK